MSSPRPRPKDRRSGFALLITITLLAFLVLLLVSLAALTRVETQVASNNQHLSQARQNALMALNVALGRLQATAGPDTRVTATADIIAGRHTDKKNWTGVWNADAPGADKNIAWLVSGAPAPGAATIVTALASTDVITLVGEKTVDTSVAENEVKVRTEPIIATSAPGHSGPQTIGNFAYWIGDEGVKAKVSISNPWETPADETLATSFPESFSESEKLIQADRYRLMTAQRMGIEGVSIDDLGDTQLDTHYFAQDTTFKASLQNLVSLPQLSLAGLNAADRTALAAARRNRFHDLTANSLGLITDVVNGGWKQDLTAWMANDAPASPAPDDYMFTGAGSQFGIPKWGMLHDYARYPAYSGAVPPRQQTDTRQGIHPVLTYARIGYNISCAAAGQPLRVNIMPVVALWNPFNVPIANSTYEVCFSYVSKHTGGDALTNTNKILRLGLFFQDMPFPNQTGTFFPEILRAGSSDYHGTGDGQHREFFRFRLVTTRVLQPGESRLYTIVDTPDDLPYESGVSTLSDAIVAPDNAVYIDTQPLTQTHLDHPTTYWFTYPELAGSIPQTARMEILLTVPPPAGLDVPATNAALRGNAYQRVLGTGMFWMPNTQPITIPPANNGQPLFYQSIELTMSTLPVTEAHQYYRSGQSTPRWLAMINPQAKIALRKPFPEGSTTQQQSNFNLSHLTDNYILANSPAVVYHEPPQTDNGFVSAGTRVSTTGAAQKLVVREFPPENTPIFSLAQLQHVNVSSLNVNPTYAIGNSLANIYVDRTATETPALPDDAFVASPDSGFPDSSTFNRIYDLSYHLNRVLWDGYFFSTIPSGLTSQQAGSPHFRLPNARHQIFWKNGSPTVSEYNGLLVQDEAASHLLVNGAFNVNSTSEQAWRALLHSHNVPAGSQEKHRYSRYAVPHDNAVPNATWLGYRVLTDSEIKALASAIVQEVRLRGPFLSMASFVNRRLIADVTGLKGTLQAAIDTASLASPGELNNKAPFTDPAFAANNYPRDILDSMGYNYPHSGDPEQQAIYMGGTNPAHPSSSRAAFAPGYLTQADLLSAIGPSLTARSDTFRIRTYGNTVNPTTGAVDGQAWCEAIVQRQPDYVDPDANTAITPPSALGPTNREFGRRFKIVSFRWLTAHDL